MTDYRLIGRRIREIRERRHMTQEELAEAADISAPYVSCIERATKKPSLETLIAAANALGVTVDEFLAGNLCCGGADYQTDWDELTAECSTAEKRLAYELSSSLIRILRDNRWTL